MNAEQFDALIDTARTVETELNKVISTLIKKRQQISNTLRSVSELTTSERHQLERTLQEVRTYLEGGR